LKFAGFTMSCGDLTHWALCPTSGEPVLLKIAKARRELVGVRGTLSNPVPIWAETSEIQREADVALERMIARSKARDAEDLKAQCGGYRVPPASIDEVFRRAAIEVLAGLLFLSGLGVVIYFSVLKLAEKLP
jgi:hypothetical protein